MTESFDPYQQWLGIAPAEQPVNHYRLLGLDAFTQDRQAIQAAAEAQMRRVNMYRRSAAANRCEEVIYRINVARSCLLNPSAKTRYDRQLQQQFATGEPSQATAAAGAAANVASLPAARAAQNAATTSDQSHDDDPLAAESLDALFDEELGGAPLVPDDPTTEPTAGPSSGSAEDSNSLPGLDDLFNMPLHDSATSADGPIFDTHLASELDALADLPGASRAAAAKSPGEGPIEAAEPLRRPAPSAAALAPIDFTANAGAAAASVTAALLERQLPFACGYRLLPPAEEVPVIAADVGYDRLTADGAAAVAAMPTKARPVLLGAIVTVVGLLVVGGIIAAATLPLLVGGPSGVRGRPRAFNRTEPNPAGETAEGGALPPAPAAARRVTPTEVAMQRIGWLQSEAASLQDLDVADPQGVRQRRRPIVARDLLHWSQRAVDPPTRLGMLRSASTLAALGSQADLATRCLDVMGSPDRWDAEYSVWRALAFNLPSRAQQAEKFALAERLFRQALVDRRFAQAGELVRATSAAAERTNRPDLQERCATWGDQLGRVQASHDAFRAAEPREPMDSAASAATAEREPAEQALGEWLCFFEWDWPRGLSHLAESGDELYRQIAAAEAAVTTAEQQNALGDLYWQAARQAESGLREALLCRAGYWYEQAQAGQPAGSSSARTARLDEIANVACPPGVDPRRIGDMWWQLADNAPAERAADLHRRAAYWYGQCRPEYLDAAAAQALDARAQTLATLSRAPLPEPGAWQRQLAWPAAFVEPGDDPASPARFVAALGQYGGAVRLDQDHMRLCGMQSTTALWLPEPVLDRFQLQLEIQRAGDGDLCVWLGGPGHGNATAAGYCLCWKADRLELLRDGQRVASAPAPTATGDSPPPMRQLTCVREGDHLVCLLGAETLIDWRDPQPLAGPSHAHVGFGCIGGRADGGWRVGQVMLRRPLLIAAERTRLALRWPALPLAAQASPAGAPLWAVAGNDFTRVGWFHSQPEASVVLPDGQLMLSGPAAAPAVVCRDPLDGDFAFEAVFQYVLPSFPTPDWNERESHQQNYLRTGGEEANFRLLVIFAPELPPAEHFQSYQPDLPAGWEITLPAGDGVSSLAWMEGRQRQRLASTAYDAPSAGCRNLVRVERRGARLRVLLNGSLLLEAEHPAGGRAFVGMRQVFGGSIVSEATAWPLAGDASPVGAMSP